MNTRVVQNYISKPHPGLQNWKCPITFLKICVRALQNEIKIWVFIESSWFLILDNIQDLSHHIIEKYSERSPKRSPEIEFCKCLKSFKKWENSLPFLKISKFENIGGSVLGSILNISRKFGWVSSEYYLESKIKLIW